MLARHRALDVSITRCPELKVALTPTFGRRNPEGQSLPSHRVLRVVHVAVSVPRQMHASNHGSQRCFAKYKSETELPLCQVAKMTVRGSQVAEAIGLSACRLENLQFILRENHFHDQCSGGRDVSTHSDGPDSGIIAGYHGPYCELDLPSVPTFNNLFEVGDVELTVRRRHEPHHRAELRRPSSADEFVPTAAGVEAPALPFERAMQRPTAPTRSILQLQAELLFSTHGAAGEVSLAYLGEHVDFSDFSWGYFQLNRLSFAIWGASKLINTEADHAQRTLLIAGMLPQKLQSANHHTLASCDRSSDMPNRALDYGGHFTLGLFATAVQGY